MRRFRGQAVAAAGVIALAASCASAPNGRKGPRDELEAKRERLAALRSGLSAEEWRSPDSLGYYLDIFGLPRSGARARLIESGGKLLFALDFPRDEPIGRALVVHGYMAHSGHFGAAVRALLGGGYEVTLIDLPGFGLSDGKPNAIDDFGDYGDAVAAAAVIMRSESSGLPLAALGHSTGAAALTDFALRYPERAAAFDRFVMAAPLVRLTAWGLKLAGVKIVGERAVRFPRLPLITKGTIGNPDHTRFVMEDPLYRTVFDPSWVISLDRWVEWIGDGAEAPWAGSVLILQGEDDDVVDRRYNLPIVSRIFPRSRIVLYPGLSHCILQEAPLPATPVYAEIEEFLRR